MIQSGQDKEMLARDSSASRGVLPGRQSSLGVTRLIQEYKQQERLTLQQDIVNGTIELVPNLQICYGQIQVSFLIGAKRKYVLKNVRNFANAMVRREFVSYGKELGFYHTLEAFTEDSRPLAEFLMQEQQMRKWMGQRRSYYSDKWERHVSLNDINLDHFFHALGDREFTVEMEYTPGKTWRVSREACLPRLCICGLEDGVMVETEALFYTCGRNYVYVWKDGVVYQTPVEDAREIQPFWDCLRDYRYEKLFVGKQELPVFCREVLPVLQRHYLVERQQFHEQAYLPPKPEYEIYLDVPAVETVLCEMFAVYGDRKYNIFQKAKVIENRDELEELKAARQVQRWFPSTDPQKGQMFITGDDEQLYALLTQGMAELSEIGTLYVSDALKAVQVKSSPELTVGVSLKKNLLELTLDSPEMPLSELVEILGAYKQKRKFFRLKSGDFLSMEDSGLSVLSRIQEGTGIAPKQWAQGIICLP